MATLNQMKFTRGYTLRQLKKSVDTAWDTVPTGFNNTIRWNVGHIFVTMETLMKAAVETYEIVQPQWIPFFTSGSSPQNWEGGVPSNEELLEALKGQTERISGIVNDRLSSKLKEPVSIGPVHKMETVEAVLQFVLWHEGVHSGIINAMNRC